MNRSRKATRDRCHATRRNTTLNGIFCLRSCRPSEHPSLPAGLCHPCRSGHVRPEGSFSFCRPRSALLWRRPFSTTQSRLSGRARDTLLVQISEF